MIAKKTARIGLRLTPAEKKKWEREAMKRGYRSLAAFITTVINREIS